MSLLDTASKLLKTQRDLEAARASQAVGAAAVHSPDKWLTGLNASTAMPRVMTPVSAVHDDGLEEFWRSHRDRVALQDAPRTSSWLLEDPLNAGLASDDIENLSTAERMSREIWRAPVVGTAALIRGTISGGVSIAYGVTAGREFTQRFEPVSAEISDLGQMQAVDNGEIDAEMIAASESLSAVTGERSMIAQYFHAGVAERRAMRQAKSQVIDEYIESNPEVFSTIAKAYKEYKRTQGKLLHAKGFLDIENVDDFATWAGESIGQVVPQIAGTAALSLILKRPAVVTGLASVTSAFQLLGEGVSKAIDDGQDIRDPQAGRHVIAAAFAGGLLEKFGIPGRLSKQLGGELTGTVADLAWRATLKRVGAEAGTTAFTEGLTEVLQEFTLDLMIKVNDKDFDLENYVNTFFAGAIGGFGASVPGAGGQEVRLRRHQAAIEAAPLQKDKVAQLNKTASALKLREKSVERAKGLFQSVGYGDKQVYVPPADLQSWAEKNEVNLEADLGVSQAQLDAAAEAGTKVAINAANYATVVPGTKDAAWFEENGTVEADALSQAEAVQAKAELDNIIQDIQKAAEQDAQVAQMRNDLFVEFERQLTEQGVKNAQGQAAVVSSVYLSIARMGNAQNAKDVLDRFGLTIQGPLARGAPLSPEQSGAAPGALPSTAPGAVLDQPVPGFQYDNPGGEWLRSKQQRAEQEMASATPDRRASASMRGAITATSPADVSFSAADLAQLPGLLGEQRAPGDPRYDSLLESVQKEGFDPGQKRNRVVVAVNHLGEAYILEGNTRVAVANATGVERVNAEVRYWNGGEQAAGDWSPAAVAARAAPAEGQTLNQPSVDLFENPIPVASKKLTDIAAAMTQRHMEKYGRKLDPTTSDDDYQIVLESLAAEIQHQLGAGKSGKGWYSKDVDIAIRETAKVYPRVATPEGRAVWLVFAGLFSNGSTPQNAWQVSAEAFAAWDATGVIPVTRGEAARAVGKKPKMSKFKDKKTGEAGVKEATWSQRGPTAEQQLQVFRTLVEQQGGVLQAVEWMMSQQPKGAINKLMADGGMTTPRFKTKAEREGTDWGALFLGDKLGRYTLGLQGMEVTADDTTVDSWYIRSYRRHTGGLLDGPIDQTTGIVGQPSPAKGGIERKTLFRLTGDLAAKFDMSAGDTQAVMWFYEKRLWGAHGQTVNEGTNSAGAQKLLESLGRADEFDDGEGGDGARDAGPASDAAQAAAGGDRDAQAAAAEGGADGGGEAGATRTLSQGGLGRYQSLPGAPRGVGGPIPELVDLAEKYAAENDIDYQRQPTYVQVDEARATRIADAYEEMKHDPSDPKVKEAYEDLARQVLAQYQALVDGGYSFTFFGNDDDPYATSPVAAIRDLRENKSMAVYSTAAGYGTGSVLNIGLADPAGGKDLDPQEVLKSVEALGEVVESSIHTSDSEQTLVIKLKSKMDGKAADKLSRDLGQEAIAQRFDDETGALYGPQAEAWSPYNPAFFLMPDGRRASDVSNPMLADTGIRWKDQAGNEQPVLFNDLFRAVHDAFGHGLEGAGFRAQGEENAWQAHARLFHGPALGALTTETRGQNSWLNYGPHGEKNRTAGLFDTVFAEQKIGLMPEWTWQEGLDRTLDQSALHGTPNQTPFSEFDLRFMGTGEGAQAYGWGLYFATRRGVAEHYRNMRSGMIGPHGIPYDTSLGSGQFESMLSAMQFDLRELGIQLPDDQLDFLVGDYVDANPPVGFEEFAAARTGGMYDRNKAQILVAARALDSEGWKLEGGGRIYNVEIPDNEQLFYYDGDMSDQPHELRMRLLEALEGQHEVAQLDPGLKPQEQKQWQILAQNVENNRFTFEMVYDSLGTLLSSSQDRGVRDKAASEWLRDVVGVPGHRFLDSVSRGNDVNDPENTYNFVIYDDRSIAIKSFEQSAKAQPPRAQIDLKKGALGENVIRLFAGNDPTSLLHEMGHLWLEAFQTLATDPRATDQMRRDMVTINKWLGREEGDTSAFTTAQQEQWAEGIERYVMEGNAPSRALRKIFSEIASFMRGVYSSVTQLSVEISPEVADVMDRIFATDSELAEARAARGDAPLLAPAELGMPKSEWAAYQKMAGADEATSQAELLKSAMATVRAKTKAEYKSRLAELRVEVEGRLRQEPEYRLLDALGNGTDPDIGDGARLDAGEIEEMFEPGVLKDLHKNRLKTKKNIYQKGGSPLEYAAAEFGFDGVEDMMNRLLNTRPLKEAVEAEARRLGEAELADIVRDGQIQEEAMAALHNARREDRLAYELATLNKATGSGLKGAEARAALLDQLREKVDAAMDSMPVGQILNVDGFLNAERSAARQAEQALLKVAKGGGMQALQEARQAKYRQTLSALMYKEARARSKSIERARLLAVKMESAKRRAVIHRAYLPHIDAILERFEFRRGRQPGRGDLPTIRELIDALTEANGGVAPPELINNSKIVDGRPRPYTTLLGGEVKAVVDQLNNLVKLGREAHKQEQEQIKASRAFKIGEILANVDAKFGTREVPRSKGLRGKLHEASNALRNLVALSRNISGVVRALDGENDNGPMYRNVLRPVQQATARAELRGEQARERLLNLFKAHYPGKQLRALQAVQRFPELPDTPLLKSDILVMALNAGNEGNWNRLADESNRWTADQAKALIENNMTENDWRFVQSVWNEINSYWPEAAALEMKHTGVEPKKVAAQIMVNAPAFVTGGYYPIVYDGELDAKTNELDAKNLQDAGLSGHSSKVMTRDGHLKKRTDGIPKRPIMLDLSAMLHHVTQVTRDIEMRDAVIEAHKLVNHPDFSQGMLRAGLQDTQRALVAWIKDTAAGEASRSGAVNGFFKHVRRNISLSAMAFSATTGLVQPLGLVQSGELAGWGTLRRGMLKTYGRLGKASEFANSKSAIMRNRQRSMDKEMLEIQKAARARPTSRFGIEALQGLIGRLGFWHIQKMQYYTVDLPTWTGVYDREIRKGASEQDAAAMADRLLIEAQGSGSQLERSAFERGRIGLDAADQQGSELVRIWSVMGSYLLNKWNRVLSRSSQLRRGEIGAIQFTLSMIQLLALEAALQQAFRYAISDDDDDESMLESVGMKVAADSVSVVPVAGPLLGSFVSGYDASSPVSRYITTMGRALKEAGEAVFDEDYEVDRASLTALSSALGAGAGLPSSVMNRAIRAIWDEDLRPAKTNEIPGRMLRAQAGGRLDD